MSAIDDAVQRLLDEKRYIAPDMNGSVQLTYAEIEALIAAGESVINIRKAMNEN